MFDEFVDLHDRLNHQSSVGEHLDSRDRFVSPPLESGVRFDRSDDLDPFLTFVEFLLINQSHFLANRKQSPASQPVGT